MYTVAIIAQKGGVGKTTLALSLAVAAEKAGWQSLVIDLDSQASACKWGDRRRRDTPLIIDAQPARLQNALDKAAESGIDIAFIDTPPSVQQPALAAAKAADLVLVPTCPQILALETVSSTIDILKLAGHNRAMIILNCAPPRGLLREEAVESVKPLGLPICPAILTYRAAPFGYACTAGLTVLEYEPNGKAAREMQLVYRYTTQLLDHLSVRKPDHEQQETKLNKRAV